MIELVHGRGQLGEHLKKYADAANTTKNIYIYHTWNPWDKEYEVQKTEYEKFKLFVDDHSNDRIVFVSTYSENENYYVHYKQRSEAYLLARHPNGIVVRLPNIIGKKGIIQDLKDGNAAPFGEMEIISLERAAQRVMESITHEGPSRLITVKGHNIPAYVIRDLFGGTQ